MKRRWSFLARLRAPPSCLKAAATAYSGHLVFQNSISGLAHPSAFFAALPSRLLLATALLYLVFPKINGRYVAGHGLRFIGTAPNLLRHTSEKCTIIVSKLPTNDIIGSDYFRVSI